MSEKISRSMTWIRRVLAVPLVLVTFICVIGSVRIFTGNRQGSTTGEGFMTTLFAAATGVGVSFLLRPDIRLRGLSFAQVRKWFVTNPLGQAVLLFAGAALIMTAVPKAALLPGLVAQCAYTALSTRSAGTARRFWPTALLALLGFILLMFALAGTAEALTPRGFGEAGMLFLLPMYGFPILLAIFGIVRSLRRARPRARRSPAAEPQCPAGQVSKSGLTPLRARTTLSAPPNSANQD